MSRPHPVATAGTVAGFPRSSRLSALVLALVILGATGAQAEAGPRVLAFTFEHQPAAEALTMVRQTLSPMGTVELQPSGNTLVIRDHAAVLERVESALARFDRPPRNLRFDIHLLRASDQEGPGSAPQAVTERLRSHLRFAHYELLAQARVSSREGDDITYALGSRFGVSFRAGAMIEDTLKLHGFRISQKPRITARSTNKSRQPAPRELIQTDINLQRDRQFTLVLSQGRADSQALAIVITFRPDDPPRRR